jgi:hypothetical protein
MTGDRCAVCGADTHRSAGACARCKRILERVETRRDASGGLRRAGPACRLRVRGTQTLVAVYRGADHLLGILASARMVDVRCRGRWV